MSLRSRFRKWLCLTPTALVLSYFFFLIFAVGSIIEIWIPSLGTGANFPGLCPVVRAAIGILLIIFIFYSILYMSDRYSLCTVYFFCAIRISDAVYGGPAISAFLWFGAALICTYSVYQANVMDRIIEKRIEEKKERKQ